MVLRCDSCFSVFYDCNLSWDRVREERQAKNRTKFLDSNAIAFDSKILEKDDPWEVRGQWGEPSQTGRRGQCQALGVSLSLGVRALAGRASEPQQSP